MGCIRAAQHRAGKEVASWSLWKDKGEGVSHGEGREVRGGERGMGTPRMSVLQGDDHPGRFGRRLRLRVLVGPVPGAGPAS